MITRVNRAKEGFAEYMITGARKDSIYKREQMYKMWRRDKCINLIL